MSSLVATFLLAIALAMDAFAVSLARGARPGLTPASTILIAATFGLFQGLMPLLGLLAGELLLPVIEAVDHWVAFALLSAIGVQMIRASRSSEETESRWAGTTIGSVLLLAVATSIDAAVAGITLPVLGVTVPVALAMIGIVTFLLCLVGLRAGAKLGERYGRRAELLGGILLIALGTKILIEHLSA